jgi:hypothetical protein
MKTKLNILLVLFATLALSLSVISCSKDKDDKDNNDDKKKNESIIGTWKYTKVEAGEIKTNSSANDAIIKDYIVENRLKPDFQGSVFKFKEDGTVDRIDEGEDNPLYTIPYSFSDGILTMNGIVNKASINKGVLTIEIDLTDRCNSEQVEWMLTELGVTDMGNGFHVTKATGKVTLTKQ